MPNKIFVQIAAYRDPELKNTLADCIAKAKFPENLIFSICWQHTPEDEWDNLDLYKEDDRFKIIDMHISDAKGVCYARNLLQQQYAGEMYTLQLDSHHRFRQDWDFDLIQMFHYLVNAGFTKPLLTTYLGSYNPAIENSELWENWRMDFSRFAPEGVIHTAPSAIPQDQLKFPIRGRFYSAHFAFTWGSFCLEVPHDPVLYFHGEEPSIAVRAFTHGYDIFHPNESLIIHEYNRAGKRRHWDDLNAAGQGQAWLDSDKRSHERFRQLLGVSCTPIDFGIHGLGSVRSLKDYERYAGIRFFDKSIQKYTLDNLTPPNPYIPFVKDYDLSFLAFYKHCIDIQYSEVPENDYNTWAVSFNDKDGKDVHRQDCNEEDIARFRADPDKYCKIWREFFYDPKNPPVECRVWPHSMSKGWTPAPIVRRLVQDEEAEAAHVPEVAQAVHEKAIMVSPMLDSKIIQLHPEKAEAKIELSAYDPKHVYYKFDGDVVTAYDEARTFKKRYKIVGSSSVQLPGVLVVDGKILVELEDVGVPKISGRDYSSATIFVQIAAYRDNDLENTLKSLLENADRPELLTVCIAWQHSAEDVWDTLDNYKTDTRFIILDIEASQTKGVCWARNLIQSKYSNQKYTLQLDSHHRFVKGWDTVCIEMMDSLKKAGHNKPLLTAYLPSFEPHNDPAGRSAEPWAMNFDRFTPEGAVFFYPSVVDNWTTRPLPMPGRFYSAHFAFTVGRFCVEVPHDPNILFHGEEISLAVRMFTCGYDIFYPHKMVAWHEYSRSYRRKVWDDDRAWTEKHLVGLKRNRQILGIDGESTVDSYGKYGMGHERTVEEYEAYAGIRFKDRAIQKYTAENKEAPNPVYSDIDDYNASFCKRFKHFIDIHYNQVTETDYDLWVVAVSDDKGFEIHRRDIQSDEIARYFADPDRYCKVLVEFYYEEGGKPSSWRILPHSNSKGWCQDITGNI